MAENNFLLNYALNESKILTFASKKVKFQTLFFFNFKEQSPNAYRIFL